MTMNWLPRAFAFAGLVTLAASAVAGARAERYSLPGYDLPAGCPAFAERHDRIWDRLVIQQDVNRFHYYEAICEQYFLARKSPETAEHDYVSTLDFATLMLDRIPYISCELDLGSRESHEWCKALDDAFPDLSQAHYYILERLAAQAVFPEATPRTIAAARAVPVDRQTCRLEKRESGGFADFKKNLVIQEARAVCIKVPRIDLDSGFTIVTSRTLFRDVDDDGFMDALLIINESSDGSQSNTETIIVTKKQPGPGTLTKVSFQRRWDDWR